MRPFVFDYPFQVIRSDEPCPIRLPLDASDNPSDRLQPPDMCFREFRRSCRIVAKVGVDTVLTSFGRSDLEHGTVGPSHA